MSNYPKAPENCYSLLRWKHAPPSKSPCWLAGWLKSGVSWTLEGQGLRLELPREEIFTKSDLGRFLAVLVHCEDIRWETAEFGKIVSLQEKQMLTPSGEGEPVGASPVRRRQRWIHFLKDVRDIFCQNGLDEVQTPTLVPSPGGEAHVEPFVTEFFMGAHRKKLFLPMSPEIHLKKLLASGWTDIFEIGKSFRNEEVSAQHEPEFWMLEWYRAFADLKVIERDCLHLFEELEKKKWLPKVQPPVVKTVAELFEEHLNVSLTPWTTIEELQEWVLRENLSPQGEWEDLFYLLFLDRIEPKLAQEPGPVLVYGYPPNQAAMARVGDEGWSERFELYFQGVELANAFQELNDPNKQQKAWDRDQVERSRQGREPLPMDSGFQRALESGMPPAAGVALGLERLFMICENISDFKDLREFSAQRWE